MIVQNDFAAPEELTLWDVARVDFPFAEQPVWRRRPGLIIANPRLGKSFNLVWLVMITSARHEPWPGDVPISDLQSAGLSRPSYIRTAKVTTLDTRLTSRIGHLARQDQSEVMRCLRQALAPLLTPT